LVGADAARRVGAGAVPSEDLRVIINTVRLFRLVRIAIAVATALGIVSMIAYPGGAAYDRARTGYAFWHNFLSDLGMTVAFNGQRNTPGAMLFASSVALLAIGGAGCLVGSVQLNKHHAGARRLSRAGGVFGLLVCAAFVGVASTPEDRLFSLHLQLTLFGFKVFPIPALLVTAAAYANPAVPIRVRIAWSLLTAAVIGYAGMLEWGPTLSTPQGFTTQVIAQKAIAIVAIGLFSYLSFEGERLSRHGVA
jgi:hypothetical protein